jgi:SAM-dependent methyltransferase
MKTAKDHYDQQLAAVYSWMMNTPVAIQRNRDLFHQLQIDLHPKGLAVDLGSGSGFQAIPLAEMGYFVVAIDFCAALLSELEQQAKSLPIRTVQDDLLSFPSHIDVPAELIVCMGDTLTHLESLDAVQALLVSAEKALAKSGKLIFTFRDYVTVEPQGNQRFILVKNDASTILTCFLEYHTNFVEVFDLLYRKEGDDWKLNVSSYPKLRIDPKWLCEKIRAAKLVVLRQEMINGMICLVAQKP